MATLDRALEIAHEAHAGQVDKAGRPYIEHVLRVVDAVEGDDAKIVAALHDVLEECPEWTGDRLLEEGFPGLRVADVLALTKSRNENYQNYIRWICNYSIPRLVKIADLRDNSDPARLALLPEKDRARLTKKYAAALATLGADPASPLSRGEGAS